MENRRINIAIHGFGRMGKIVYKYVRRNKSLRVGKIIDLKSSKADFKSVSEAKLKNIDAIIDFSTGASVLKLAEVVAAKDPKIRIVSGTSAWEGDEQEVIKIVKRHRMFLLHGANFAIGTNLYMRIINYASELFNKFEAFDPSLLDIHHRHKKDMPSGTAKKIAEKLVDNIDRKSQILYGIRQGELSPSELHVNCLRTGENKGFHQVSFDSEEEVVTIAQQSRTRGAYVQGAIWALLWLMDHDTPGYYVFDDCLNDMLR